MATDFAAGGLAALSAITCVHPVDVVKTRLQVQGESGTGTGKYRGVARSLALIAREEGVRGLYSGIGAAYALQFAVTATRFGVYGLAKRARGPDGGGALGNFGLAALAGACGGALGTPFFAIKTRAQAAAMSTGAAPSLLAAMRDLVRERGLAGLTQGAEAFVPRVVFYGAAQLGVYDMVKPIAERRLGLSGLPLQAATSVVAAAAAVAAIQPFDFLAARLMNQPVDAQGKGRLYRGMVDCAVKSVAAEGPTCMLKGCWANMCRMGPYTVLVLVFFEQFKGALQR